jgi:hypothetical protein
MALELNFVSARTIKRHHHHLLASLRARQVEENGEDAARPSLPLQRQVTQHIMENWLLHARTLQNPPTDRMRDVHMLHHTQLVPMIDETSALCGNMPQRNDAEGGKNSRLSFSPASSVWGQMGLRSWKSAKALRKAGHESILSLI